MNLTLLRRSYILIAAANGQQFGKHYSGLQARLNLASEDRPGTLGESTEDLSASVLFPV